jgi:hypothetical protein
VQSLVGGAASGSSPTQPGTRVPGGAVTPSPAMASGNASARDSRSASPSLSPPVMAPPGWGASSQAPLSPGAQSSITTPGAAEPFILSSASDPNGFVRYFMPRRVVVNGQSVPVGGVGTFATLADGGVLPAWLVYEPGRRSFLSTGSFVGVRPLRVHVHVPTSSGAVVIVPVLIPQSVVTTPVIRGLW